MHGTETKNKGKKQKPSSSEETAQAIVREGSLGGKRETLGVGFVKQILIAKCYQDVMLAIKIMENNDEEVVNNYLTAAGKF